MTRVRLFAALRDAAGTGRTESSAGTVAELLAELRERYGERFAARLAVATVIVDGEPVDPAGDGAGVALGDVEEVALLPPFSGG